MLWILASVAFALLCYEIPTLITAVLWPLWHNPNALQTDFHYYDEAARRFAAGGPLYLATDDVIAGFAYPPPAIVPFVWLARLPFGAALLLVTLASYAALLLTIVVWLSYLDRQGSVNRSTRIAIGLIVLAAGPTYMNAMFGQVNAFVLASAVLFVVLASVWPFAAGFVLALGAWLKVYPAVLVVIAAWDRRAWRAVGSMFVAAVVIAVLVAPLVPLDAYRAYIAEVLPSRVDKTAIHISNQSLVAFLERFRYPSDQFLNWTGEQAVTVSGLARAINWGVAVAALFVLWKRGPKGLEADTAAGLIALIAVLAPLGWGHTYMMVLPLMVLQLIAMSNARPIAAAAIFLCVAALMIPAGRHLPIDSAPAWLQNLLYSRYLLATTGLILISSARVGRTNKLGEIASA